MTRAVPALVGSWLGVPVAFYLGLDVGFVISFAVGASWMAFVVGMTK